MDLLRRPKAVLVLIIALLCAHPGPAKSEQSGAVPDAAPTVLEEEEPGGAPSAMPTVLEAEGTGGAPSAMPTVLEEEEQGGAPSALPTVLEEEEQGGAPSATPAVREEEEPDGAPSALPTVLEEEGQGGAPSALPTVLEEEGTGGAPSALPTVLEEEEQGGAPSAAPTVLEEEGTGGAPSATPTVLEEEETGTRSDAVREGAKTGEEGVGSEAACVPTAAEPQSAPGPDTAAQAGADVAALSLDRDALSLLVGEEARLVASGTDVRWRSSDESVITVAGGLVAAVGPGEADAIATTPDGERAASCRVYVRRAVSEIAPTQAKLSLGVGEKRTLVCDLAPADAVPDLCYSSSDKRVAKVNASGVVTAKGTGRAVITIEDAGGATAQVTVRVWKAPRSVSLSAARNVVGVGETLPLEVGFSKGYGGGYALFSGDESVAEISGDAVVARAPGTSRISVRTYNGKTKKGTLTVRPAPESVRLDQTELTLGVGEKTVLTAALSEGSAGVYTFSSGDETVARVGASTGKVTAVGAGIAEIVVRTYNGCESVCRVTVSPAPKSVELSLPDGMKALGVGERLRLSTVLLPEGSAGRVAYKSSNARCVAVNKNGVVTGKRAGCAVITATAYNGKKTKLTVTVKKAPQSLSLSFDRALLGVGESTRCRVRLPSGSAGGSTLESSDESIARVEDGRVVAVGPGSAVITATAYNGKSCGATIQVASAPEEVRVSPDHAVIGVGDSLVLAAVLNEGSAGACGFSGDAPTVAAVDSETGAVKAAGVGEATVTVTAYNGVQASAQISVVAAPEKLTLLAPAPDAGAYLLEIEKGDTFQIVPDMDGRTAMGMTYKSAKTSVASVSASGLVTAKGSGSCTVTATAYNGKSVKIRVTVKIWVDMLDDDYVAHAMGDMEDKTYTNSLDAFLTNYALGCRIFECDLSRTADGGIVLWHNWAKNQINAETPLGYVPTLAEFRQMKIDDKYTPLTYRDLIALMKEYPDARFLIDSKLSTPEAATQMYSQMRSIAEEEDALGALDRTIVYVYSKSIYRAIDDVYHFDQYVYAFYFLDKKAPSTERFKAIADFCAQNGIDVIALPDEWWSAGYMSALRKADLAMEIHVVNSAARAKKLRKSGVSWICTDKPFRLER